jgi:nicotinate-nucleotide pyrophosphorylase (carboxylating)
MPNPPEAVTLDDSLESSLPEPEYLRAQVARCLAEDIGDGDLTANLLPESAWAGADVVTREPAVLCGQAWFQLAFTLLDDRVIFQWDARDGDRLPADTRLCRVEGPLRTLLTAERTALNFLQLLSGTATRAARYADAVAGLPVRILDTRKTVPGLRREQKYAVQCGGCHNHRMGLFDAVLIKENHIAAAGSVAAAVSSARVRAPAGVTVEVEVESLDELRQALAAGAERVLLDNFSLSDLRAAVALNQSRARLEASGGVTLEGLRAIAETGVDDISVGDLTKSVVAVDLSMRMGGR